jgi:hypothetical protein
MAINSPYTRLAAPGILFTNLYTNANSSFCEIEGYDLNGNCVGGCVVSNPARIAPFCNCPTNYFNNGLAAQCGESFNTS